MNSPLFEIRVLSGSLTGRGFGVSANGATLGRASSCDIAIPDPALSRQQCRFEMRGEELWIIDLASANQTMVNDKPILESRLLPDDLIMAGATLCRVAEYDSAAQTPLVDLGLQERTAEEKERRPHLLRPLLWIATAALLLIVGGTMIMDFKGCGSSESRIAPLASGSKGLLLYYEKVEADTNSIFRYEMTIAPDCTLSVKIDDLAGRKRHVRESKKVDTALLDSLEGDIESSGFFTLEGAYSGFAQRENSLSETTLTIALGSVAHTCRVVNRAPPEPFSALCAKLETFGKNELGIWAIQYSAEKLSEMARDSLAVARKKFAEREVKFGNLYEARRAFQEALFYLDTLNPKPEFYAETADGLEMTDQELEKRYQEQRFRADRAINLSEWQVASQELKILCEIIPDRTDSRHMEAAAKLLDVENRLRKRGRK